MSVKELTVLPEPELAKKFQEYLEIQYNFSKLEAMSTVGVLHKYIRKYKKELPKEELDKIMQSVEHPWDTEAYSYYIGFKDGFRKALENL